MIAQSLISVIIVNWNRKRYLERCLPCVCNQTYPTIEIIVVDNGSSDGSVEFIADNFPQVKIIKNKVNCGFAKANNIGIKAAKGKYIATLNNDAIAEKNWIENLISIAEERNDVAMFASKILSYYNHDLIESAGMLIYPDGVGRCRGYLQKDNAAFGAIEEVLLPSACAALYRKDVLIAAGLFDEDYFAYCEDIDLGLRLRLTGVSCLYVPEARVYHLYSGTSQDNLLLKIYLIERNRLWTIMKNFSLLHLFLSPFYTMKRYLFYIYGAIFKINPAKEYCAQESKIKILFILFRVYAFTLLNISKIIKKRRHIMRKKTVQKDKVINWLKRYSIGVKELTLYTEIPQNSMVDMQLQPQQENCIRQ